MGGVIEFMMVVFVYVIIKINLVEMNYLYCVIYFMGLIIIRIGGGGEVSFWWDLLRFDGEIVWMIWVFGGCFVGWIVLVCLFCLYSVYLMFRC